MNALVECRRFSKEGANCEAADDLRAGHEIFDFQRLQRADRQHGLRAVDQRDAFLQCERDRRNARLLQRFLPTHD